ncbi:hypothetical protein GBA52_008579 [Prunus armeniaca]|nr:hypothetical protein GBA52_008579 [Prunus armeniaca]
MICSILNLRIVWRHRLPPGTMPTFLNTKIGRGKRRRFITVTGVLELLHFLKTHPWLHPDFGFVKLLLSGIDCLDRQMVQSASNHLLLRLHHPHKLEQSILHNFQLIEIPA